MKVKKIFIVFLTATIALNTYAADKTAHKNKGDREGHVMKDIIPKDQIPPAPILSVDNALKSMQLQPGFIIENVISEPNVFNPVTMVFDANGRMWVCEMTRYMPDVRGIGEHIPEGNIAILEDTNGDGKVDKRTVFLHDIVLPRTITLVKGGILYADHTQLYFTEIIEKNDELTPGLREVADPTYAEGGSLEHKTNTMLYAMDNWYYNAKSNKRYQTLPLDAELPQQATEIYRNKYWKLILGETEWRGQWGLTMDDYGRLFHNDNSWPAQGEYLRPSSLRQNPGYWGKMPAWSIGENQVFPARMNPGINRGYIEEFLVQEGKNRGKLANFTAASGSVIYRGDNFPEKYYGMAVTPEPAGNLISARTIIEQDGAFTGKNLFNESELIASTDERFRPVNTYTAPDGTLYFLDMYHGILQHKEFMTTYLSEQIKARDLDKHNNTMGRIYRLRWQDKPAGPQPKLAQLTAKQLVPYLAHKNGWWRDTARRLIVEHNDHSVANDIRDLLTRSKDEKAIINGLWTLYHLNKIDYSLIKQLLTADSKQVVITSLAVADKLPNKYHDDFAKTLLKLADSDYQIGLQVALVAGAIQSPKALQASKKVLDTFIDKPLTREVVVSGLRNKSADFKVLLGSNYPDADLLYMMNNLGNKAEDKTNKELLSETGKEQYELGKKLFNGSAACFGCHGADGNGITGMGPSFWESEWVIGNPEVLAKIMLHGLMGPISIKGIEWKTSAVMPGLANNPHFDDDSLAAIATYIRNSWGNNADTKSHVDPLLFKKVRAASEDHSAPYIADELK